MNNFTDGEFESKLFIRDPSGQSREIDFTTYQKVPDKRLVRFSAPGDFKGMGVLVENKDVMYVFLPGFQKVRRVGTHVKNADLHGLRLLVRGHVAVALLADLRRQAGQGRRQTRGSST